MSDGEKIAVIGLGYVGLPLAVALAPSYPVTGFDIATRRVDELTAGHDATREVSEEKLKEALPRLRLTTEPADLEGHTLYIVTVPTPTDRDHKPDLSPVLSACEILGRHASPGALIVFESTVYPGVTEDICRPALEDASGGRLRYGENFFLGYSPERINPGDKQNTVNAVVKIVSADTPQGAERLKAVYGSVNGGRIHVAPSIRVAEAAKVIENAQRDVNIAFINEMSNILRRLGVSTTDVLAAMATKWNALPFRPGLVGGHCISVDPCYLIACARDVGYEPDVLLGARQTNDRMATRLAEELHEAVKHHCPGLRSARVLVLGLTFKEDVPDLRNSKVAPLVAALAHNGHRVTVMDSLADPAAALAEYGLTLAKDGFAHGPYDLVVGAVAHADYRALRGQDLSALVRPDGILADIKGMWADKAAALPAGVLYWKI